MTKHVVIYDDSPQHGLLFLIGASFFSESAHATWARANDHRPTLWSPEAAALMLSDYVTAHHVGNCDCHDQMGLR